MLLNLTIALSIVAVELLVLAIAGIFAYTRLKASKNRTENENSFSDVEREDLIALSQEIGKANKEIFGQLEKLDEKARNQFSPGMGAWRRGCQEALESMKMGASSLLCGPPNLAMTCHALLEANQALMQALADASRDLDSEGLPGDDEESPVDAAPSDETGPAAEDREEVMV